MIFASALVAVLGCSFGKGGDSSAPPPVKFVDDDTGADSGVDRVCGDAVPTFTSPLTIVNTGMQMYPETGGMRPTMSVTVAAHDDDGDLHTYSRQLFWDTTVDGVVDAATAESFAELAHTVSYDACTVFDTTPSQTLYIGDHGLPYDTQVDFGMVVKDALGHASEMVVATAWIPTEDGKDGGP